MKTLSGCDKTAAAATLISSSVVFSRAAYIPPASFYLGDADSSHTSKIGLKKKKKSFKWELYNMDVQALQGYVTESHWREKDGFSHFYLNLSENLDSSAASTPRQHDFGCTARLPDPARPTSALLRGLKPEQIFAAV